MEEVCEHVISYQLFVSPLNIMGEPGEVHEVTLIHYSGWRTFLPRNGDEMTGYAHIIRRIVRFYLENRESGNKALIHCKQGYVRTMTTLMTVCRFMQKLYGIDINMSVEDMIEGIKGQGGEHLFEGMKAA